MLLNVKVENHIEKNTGNTGEGENILIVIIAVGCYKQIQHCKFFHTLFGAADEEAAIRRRVQRGCMSFDGSNNCVFWCYSSPFIPQPFSYLGRDY